MARQMDKLTDEFILNLDTSKVIGKKYFDGRGLYLLISNAGNKLWQMRYRMDGKQNTLSFGHYPDVSIDEARSKCIEAKKLIRQKIKPVVLKKSYGNHISMGVNMTVISSLLATKNHFEHEANTLRALVRKYESEILKLDAQIRQLRNEPVDKN